MSRLLPTLFVSVLALAAGAGAASAGPPPCNDSTPDGGGMIEFEGIGTPNHYGSALGDLCQGDTDVWSVSFFGIGVDESLGIVVLPFEGEVSVTVEEPSGAAVDLEPNEAYRVRQFTNDALKYEVTVLGESEVLAGYRMQACRSIYPVCAFDVPPGDVDCRGETDAMDALFVLQLDAGLLPSLACPDRADVNMDGRANSLDAALILQLDGGLIGELPSAG